MPDSGIADGSVYTSAFHDTYVRQQVIAQVTSATRPTGVEGRVIYETDTEKLMVYSGAAWSTVGPVHGAGSTWTPAVTQSASVTATVNAAKYWRVGRLVIGYCDLAITSTGTASNAVSVSTPVTALAANRYIGQFTLYDSSATTFYTGGALLLTTGTFGGLANAQTNYFGVASFTAALASGDSVWVSFHYEAAADA